MAERLPGGVDANARPPVDTPQVRVELRLDPRLPDLVAEVVGAVCLALQLRSGDLPDDAEELRREIAVRIAADVALAEGDARELTRPLLEVRHERGGGC